MRSHAKATSAGSTPGHGTRRGLFGLVCLCVLGLAAFLGSGAPYAGASAACPNDALRIGSAAHLPDCRAYEMVSPLDKNGGDIDTGEQEAGVGSHVASAYRQASVHGGKITYSSSTSFGDAIAGHWSNQYIATRSSDGWSTHAISSQRARTVLEPQNPLGAANDLRWFTYSFFGGFTPDLSSAWVRDDNVNPLAPGALNGYVNLYRRDNGSDSYEPVTTQAPFGPNAITALATTVGSQTGGPRVLGVSSDMRHQVFVASAALTPDAVQDRRKVSLSGFNPGTISQLYDQLGEPTDAFQRLTVRAVGGTYSLSAEAVRGIGTLTNGSANVTAVKKQLGERGFEVGDVIVGTGVPTGTTVDSVGEGTLTLSQSATVSGAQALVAIETTDPLSATATAAQVQGELEGLDPIGAGNVVVSGGPGDATGSSPYEISFTGDLSDTPVFALRTNDLGLTGGSPSSSAAVAIADPGGETHLVSVLPNGQASYSFSFAGSISQEGLVRTREQALKNAVSDDGSRIFWSASGWLSNNFGIPSAAGSSSLYVRENPGQPQSALAHGAAGGMGALTTGSPAVSSVTTSHGTFDVGQTIEGNGIPPGTTVTAVAPGALTLSANANASGTAVPLESYSECTEPDKACTIPVAGSIVRVGGGNEARAQFWAASEDGSRLLYSVGADPDRTVFLYDVDARSATEIAKNSAGVAATAEDLSHIYLVSREDKDGTGPAVVGEHNLYDYHEGTYTRVGVVTAEDLAGDCQIFGGSGACRGNLIGRINSDANPRPIYNQTRTTPDGRHFAFMSNSKALSEETAGYDNTDLVSGKPDFEVYRYDADIEELSCVSCHPSGQRPRGSLLKSPYAPLNVILTALTVFPDLRAAASLPTHEHDNYASRLFSDDGDRLFFHSDEALVPKDTNGVQDVYQWQAPDSGSCEVGGIDYVAQNDGCLSLISSGRDAAKSEFVDADPSGDEIYFTTDQGLDPRDAGLRDIYVAKAGGGFPIPQVTAPCEGEACQTPPPPPEFGNPSSSTFEGFGNQSDARKSRCNRAQVRRGNRCVAKRQLAKRACAKRTGKAKRRCVTKQVRRLNRLQQRQIRAANTNRRVSK